MINPFDSDPSSRLAAIRRRCGPSASRSLSAASGRNSAAGPDRLVITANLPDRALVCHLSDGDVLIHNGELSRSARSRIVSSSPTQARSCGWLRPGSRTLTRACIVARDALNRRTTIFTVPHHGFGRGRRRLDGFSDEQAISTRGSIVGHTPRDSGMRCDPTPLVAGGQLQARRDRRRRAGSWTRSAGRTLPPSLSFSQTPSTRRSR